MTEETANNNELTTDLSHSLRSVQDDRLEESSLAMTDETTIYNL